MASKPKRTLITRENVLQALSEGDSELTAKVLLKRLGGQPQSAGRLQKLLLRLERDGLLKSEGQKYRLAGKGSTASESSRHESPISKVTTERWARVCAVLILVLLVAVAFYPGLSGEFLTWDDTQYVTSNNEIKSFSWKTVAWAFTNFHVSNWHPLTSLSLALDYKLYGLKPFGYHLTNLVFHGLNTVLVFLVLFRLTGAYWCSLAVAVLFGLHPMRVESVSWVSERKDVLSAFFWLLTMSAYLRYVRVNSAASYLLVAITFSLGLMSKPVVVTLPAVLLLLDYWPLKRLDWRAVREKLPLVVLAAAGLALTFAAQQGGGAVQIDAIPLSERIANAFVSYVRYIQLTLWPINLSPWYSHPALEGPPLSLLHVAGAAALLVGITLLVLHKNLCKSMLPVGWLWFLGTLVPMIGLVQIGRQGMADRYAYIPHIGLMILLVWGIAKLPIWHASRTRVAGFVLFSAVAITLGTLTWRQTSVWHSSLSLWRYTTETNPYSFIAHQGLGLVYRRAGRNNEAIAALRRAGELRPEVASVQYLLGELLTARKDLNAALPHFQKAAELMPDKASYHNHVGVTLLRLGQWEAARAPIEKALAIDGNFADAHVSLGQYWLAAGDPAKAASQFELALYIRPNDRTASRYLEMARKRLGLE